MLTINEIFHSIQGESTHAGRPCVFVRLTACDLRCSWCDTPYAFHEGRKVSVDEVVAEVDGHRLRVCRDHGRRAAAAGGRLPADAAAPRPRRTRAARDRRASSIADVPAEVIRIVDVKCPGSGESAKNHWANLDELLPHGRSEVRDPGSRPTTSSRARCVTPTRLDRSDRPRCCSRRCTTCSSRSSSLRGFSRIACRSGSSSRCTSTSGAPDVRGV